MASSNRRTGVGVTAQAHYPELWPTDWARVATISAMRLTAVLAVLWHVGFQAIVSIAGVVIAIDAMYRARRHDPVRQTAVRRGIYKPF